MRISQLFGRTLRDDPAEIDIESHKLLMRAGYIRPLGAGIFSSLHLAKRSLSKIEQILREEMDAIGGQEITMPVVHPSEIWKETGRWHQIGSEMGRFKDKNDHDMVLAMTHEEVVSTLARSEVKSYHDLPRTVYQIQTKWRDDPRPRAGLIRVREFTMKDSYSLSEDIAGLEQQYLAHYQAYHNIYRRCGLFVIAVQSDTGMMGGLKAHEFMYLSPIGEDTLLVCNYCGYVANRQVATFQKQVPEPEPLLPVKRVETPGIKTIEELASFLDIPKSKTAKAVFLIAKINSGNDNYERFIFVVIRGDMTVNETKLAKAIHAVDLRPATEEDIIKAGAVPGYASPIGLSGIFTIVDDSILKSQNLVAGANQEGYHLLNVNFGRDYTADVVCDIAAAEENDACINCGNSLISNRGIEVGNIFQLGTSYSEAMNCTFIDKDGKTKYIYMGSYGIGIGRLLACIAEEHHDALGLMWPITVAPYTVHLICLKGGEALAEKLYSEFENLKIDTLFDDRESSPGVKFNDADLIGIPIRITIGERSLKAGGVELKLRHRAEKTIYSFAEVTGKVVALISELTSLYS